MAEVVNLNKARKARDKAGREAQAAENRVRFGRAKAETSLAKAEREQAAKTLDGHKRD